MKKRPQEHFDAGLLTADDHDLLAAFQRRRDRHDRALADSNILYNIHTCPVCGFPTLDERGMYEVCVLCLWQDDGEGRDLTRVAPPNYTSMLQERVNLAGMLAHFERTHEISESLHDVVGAIREFKGRCRRGEAAVDRDDFAAHLRAVLPTRPRT